MSNAYERVLQPINNKAPKYDHAYINKLNVIAVRKVNLEVKQMMKDDK